MKNWITYLVALALGISLSAGAHAEDKADPLHTRVMLLTAAFDDSNGEVVKWFVNGFPDKDSCTEATIALAATASQQIGEHAHIGMSLCFGDATVYGGTAQPVAVAPSLVKMDVMSIPQEAKVIPFDTADEAAIAALKNIDTEYGDVYEWGGAIGRLPSGKYVYFPPSTEYAGDNTSMPHTVPRGVDFVANYHTHPCLTKHDVEFFSPPDLFSVIFGHDEATFMGDFCTGNVHKFELGDKPDLEQIHNVWITKGRIIGQFTGKHKMYERFNIEQE